MAKRRADGEGNVRQKRPNLWEGRIVAGHKKDGSPIYKYVSGRTQKEAYEKLSKINDHLYEGKYSPRDANGKRISRNVYAKTREECEMLLAEMIKEMKAEIQAERERIKAEQSM